MTNKFKNNAADDTYTLEDRLHDIQDEEKTPFVGPTFLGNISGTSIGRNRRSAIAKAG